MNTNACGVSVPVLVNYVHCPVCSCELPGFVETDKHLLSGDSHEWVRSCESYGIFHFKERILWFNRVKKNPSQQIRIQIVEDTIEDSEYFDIEYTFLNDDPSRPQMTVLGNAWEQFQFHYKVNSFSTADELQLSLRRLNNFK